MRSQDKFSYIMIYMCSDNRIHAKPEKSTIDYSYA
jgi:hypothetical protein